MNSWSWIILIGVAIVGIVLYRIGGRLGKLQLPSWLRGNSETAIEKLESQTERERESAEELRKVLEAKRELMRARSASNKIRREIAGTTEKTVVKEELQKEHQAGKTRRL